MDPNQLLWSTVPSSVGAVIAIKMVTEASVTQRRDDAPDLAKEQRAPQRQPFLLVAHGVRGESAGYQEAQADGEARYDIEALALLQKRGLRARKGEIRAHQAQHDPGEHSPHRNPGAIEVLSRLPGNDTEGIPREGTPCMSSRRVHRGNCSPSSGEGARRRVPGTSMPPVAGAASRTGTERARAGPTMMASPTQRVVEGQPSPE